MYTDFGLDEESKYQVGFISCGIICLAILTNMLWVIKNGSWALWLIFKKYYARFKALSCFKKFIKKAPKSQAVPNIQQ